MTQLVKRQASTTQLATLTRLERKLAAAVTIEDHWAGHNEAEAFRECLKRAGLGLKIQNQAAEISLAHVRGGGTILATMERQGRGQPKKGPIVGPYLPTLETLGMNKNQSSRWQAIARIPDETFDAFLEEIRTVVEDVPRQIALTFRGALTLARRLEGTHETNPILNLPPGIFACLVIDPPWPIKKIERDEVPDQGGWEYSAMTEEQLAAAPIPSKVGDNAHLYLWVTHKYLPMGLRLAEKWGFKYECLMTWVKDGGFTPYSWMYSTEHVLFCRKGKLEVARKGLRLDFQEKRREHGRKPDAFYDLVRQASPEPRLEVFGREAREGFVVCGDEAEKFV